MGERQTLGRANVSFFTVRRGVASVRFADRERQEENWMRFYSQELIWTTNRRPRANAGSRGYAIATPLDLRKCNDFAPERGLVTQFFEKVDGISVAT